MWSKPTNVSVVSTPTQITNYTTHDRNAQFPRGWYVCNGTNGTPNLSEKFIKGTTTPTSVGGTGGSNTKTLSTANLPSHSHTLNSHTHTITHDHTTFTSGGSSATITGSSLGAHTHSYAHAHTASSASAGSHTHTVTVNSAGSHVHTASSASAGSHTHTINKNTVNEGTTLSYSRTSDAGMHVHNISPSKTNMTSINQTSTKHNSITSSGVSWYQSYLPGHDHVFRDFYMIPNSGEYNNSINGGTAGTDLYIEKGGSMTIGGISKRAQTSGPNNSHMLYATHRTWGRGASNNGQNNDITTKSDYDVIANNTFVALWYGVGYSGVHTHNLVNTNHDHTAVDNGSHSHTVTVNSGGSHAHNASSASAGSHSHTVTVNSGGGNTSSSNLSHTHTIAHTHSIDVPNYIGSSGAASGNTGSTGSGTAFDIQPAYYQVVFIMRIS